MSKNNRIKVDVDYDKLAKAIVKAMEKKDETVKKRTRWRNTTMKWVNGIVFLFCFFASINVIIYIWKNRFDGSANSWAYCIIATIAFSILAFLSFMSQQETLIDDYSTSINHFSINISLIALLVAIYALKTKAG